MLCLCKPSYAVVNARLAKEGERANEPSDVGGMRAVGLANHDPQCRSGAKIASNHFLDRSSPGRKKLRCVDMHRGRLLLNEFALAYEPSMQLDSKGVQRPH